MLISGIQTLTLLAYPEKVGAIIFTAGCNMRCGYCHNPELVLPEKIKAQRDFIPDKNVLSFLKTRVGFLEGVVISGGEPTLQPDLLHFMRQVKALGFLIKLDTNGTNPTLLRQALAEKLLDYIAMDIKAAPARYDDLTAVKNNFEAITLSRNLIMNSGLDYEFRTTFIKGYHQEKDVLAIARFCKEARHYSLQNFRPGKTLNPGFSGFKGFSQTDLERFENLIKPFVKNTLIRN